MAHSHAAIGQPSQWVSRFASLMPEGEVLDLACGTGRHTKMLAALGHPVLAVDRDGAALASAAGPGIQTLRIDLEQDGERPISWPFAPGRYAGIVVTNYLHRPLLDEIMSSLMPGGVVIYETFAEGNQRFGKPSNPDFLLRPGELLHAVQNAQPHSLEVVAYEHGYISQPAPAMVQRICAVMPSDDRDLTLLRLN
ncbi:MAG TPA: class I SAM-dependent methyltransferase [Noviherbaspirillum sp.]|jgi:SAM-dependent methyltransferase|uniref:class I SAM-dependent methyltransferase n=1 Tax=Noviherbaspirillum sp. TaxID=1926288 RepID=UPI002DDCA10D|nr:class I SAM-dependent methyltransferase [Noviherbaspirillum sp.]HEV2612767.1 class I SAM-dependent methyltransferase [Noviherbaspirillum sp.]